jgi:hypothetical protein
MLWNTVVGWNISAPPKEGTTNFEILQAKVEQLSADDECRHNIEHMSKYVSVGDLIEDVKKKT